MTATKGKPVHERCWCWQYGRCLADCPTADHQPPVPLTDDVWRREAIALMQDTPQADKEKP